MMMSPNATPSREAVLAKITKLLRLAAGADANEAAAAAAQAQKLMDRYNIEATSASLDVEAGAGDEPEEQIGHSGTPLDVFRKASTWKLRLAACLARANACRVFTTGGTVQVVGRPSDVQVVRYLYPAISREVDRIARRECAGLGRSYANNFRLGAVDRIHERLAEAKRTLRTELRTEAAGTGNPHALVRLDQTLAKIEAKDASTEAWMDANLRLRSRPAARASYSHTAREHGRHAANSINVGGGARAALGSGRRAIRGAQ